MSAKILQRSISLKLKELISLRWQGHEKRAGGKMKVTSNMLLKTNGEKMSEICLSKMLLKKNELYPPFQDVDEKKGAY